MLPSGEMGYYGAIWKIKEKQGQHKQRERSRN
jgi:hypothetical protein